MNIINRFLLNTILLPSAIYTRMGVNVFHLRSILRTKLIMDDRRPNTFNQTQKKKKQVNAATLGTMLLSVVMGGFFLISFTVGKDYITHLTIYFTMYIFLLASSLISDFTSVLIDIRDNYIILPKPVTDRTVVTARLLHILIHISKIILPMSLPGLIFVAYNKNAWGAVVFVTLVLFASVFTIFLINASYIFILKITTPAKFQSIISYFQIFVTILMYASYQILPHIMEKVTYEDYDISHNKWMWLAPPYWFAVAWQGLYALHTNAMYLLAIALSVSIPLLSIYVVIKYFAPSFNQKLSLINSSNTEQATVDGKRIAKSTTSTYVRTMAAWFSKKGAERMSFLFCWKMTSRSKDFKLKVYPAIGYMVVLLILPFLKGGKFSFRATLNTNEGAAYIFVGFIYFSSFLIMQAIQQISYSDKFKAAWIYFTAPVNAPGELIQGALKAAMIKFYLPIVIVVSIAAMFVTGPVLLPNLLLGLCNEVLICSLITYVTIKELPFSMQQSNSSKTGNFIKGLFMLIIPAAVAVLHFLIYKFTPVVYIFIVLSIIAIWLMQGSIRKISWQQIRSKLEE